MGSNLIFDPSKEELAVADAVLALSLAKSGEGDEGAPALRLLALRTVDPPSRMTTPGLLDADNTAAGGGEDVPAAKSSPQPASEGSVWSPPVGGIKRGLVARAMAMCLGKDGVANEVLMGLQAFRDKD